MRLNELSDRQFARKPRKRVGRGIGSGKGKTSGRGHKGQKSRSGFSLLGFEGGQMPLYRRLPKRGFNNPFTKNYAELTLGNLEAAVAKGKIDAKKPVTEEVLRTSGIVKKSRHGVRLIAKGELKAKLTIEVTGASKGAIAAVEKAGGGITVRPPKPKPEGKGKARHRKFKEGAEAPKKKTESGADGDTKEVAGKEAKKGKADKKAKKNEAEQAEQQKISAGEQAQDKEEGEQPSENKEGTKGGKDGDSGSDES
jgi:large subunit ribosomal protein L15